MTQHAIGDLALLADGRTAALLDSDGNVAWLCWPRIDSEPLLFSLLDQRRGGVCSLRPAAEHAKLISRSYHEGTLVLRTTWRVAAALLHIDDALAWERGPVLVRRLRAEGGDIEVALRASWSHEAGVSLYVNGARRPTGAAGGSDRESAAHHLVVHAGAGPVVVSVGDFASSNDIDMTLRLWRELTAGVALVEPAADAIAIAGTAACRDALRISAAVLIGLRQRGGGIVAAPTTSLPQWPGTSRTWDYRYCWLRDAALAGLAMLCLGLVEIAHELGGFIGGVCRGGQVPSLVRVDGGEAPAERTVDGLSGYRDSRPVRFGNAAALQLQLDVPGEVVEFAVALAQRGALPGTLRAALPRLAAWVSSHWNDADHGIWEIRGVARQYTHSRLMAWYALHGAAMLQERGLIAGDAAALRVTAERVRSTVLQHFDAGPLELHAGGGGADAALALAPLLGFLDSGDPRAAATLALIDARLDRDGLLDRHEPHEDSSDEPCGPFLFPTLSLIHI